MLTGTTTRPARRAPSAAPSQSTPLGSWTATRSPGVRPRAAYPAATRSTRASSSPQLSRCSPATTAGASARSRAAARTSTDSELPTSVMHISSGGALPATGHRAPESDGVSWTERSDVVTMGPDPQHRDPLCRASRAEDGDPGGPTRRTDAWDGRARRRSACPQPRPPRAAPGPSPQEVAGELPPLGGALPPPVVDVWALVREVQNGDGEALGRLYDH